MLVSVTPNVGNVPIDLSKALIKIVVMDTVASGLFVEALKMTWINTIVALENLQVAIHRRLTTI